MSSQQSSSIALRFEQLKREGRMALMPFLMAGDPDLSVTAEVLLSLQAAGADMVELGMPYSDPLADGPVIQAAAARALAAGTTPNKVLEMLASLRGQLSIPVILFTYSNPLLNVGMERFCEQAAAAGASGLVVPDLPLEEAERLSPIAERVGLDLVLLVAPTTPRERMGRIAQSSRGFTYLVSVTGVTGERSTMENRVEGLVQALKQTSPGTRRRWIWDIRCRPGASGAQLGCRWSDCWKRFGEKNGVRIIGFCGGGSRIVLL
jgi:tryptophan synthase alpha chain